MTKNKKTTSKKVNKNDSKAGVLNQKVSFFTGSLIIITAFVIAASAIPSYKQDNQSALEILMTTFVEDADVKQAHIEAENFRIEIYKKQLRKAEAANAQKQ